MGADVAEPKAQTDAARQYAFHRQSPDLAFAAEVHSGLGDAAIPDLWGRWIAAQRRIRAPEVTYSHVSKTMPSVRFSQFLTSTPSAPVLTISTSRMTTSRA